MPVAIETVIIIIVVVSFTVLSAVLFALYWLWRLLLEDRRCTRLRNSSFHQQWQSSSGRIEDGTQRSLLNSQRNRIPKISRRQKVFVDERSQRMVKATRCKECTSPSTTGTPIIIPNIQPLSQSSPVVPRVQTFQPEVIVLDGTEPPPPYEATR